MKKRNKELLKLRIILIILYVIDFIKKIIPAIKRFWKLSIKYSPFLFAVGFAEMLISISTFHFNPEIYCHHFDCTLRAFLIRSIFFAYSMVAFLSLGNHLAAESATNADDKN